MRAQAVARHIDQPARHEVSIRTIVHVLQEHDAVSEPLARFPGERSEIHQLRPETSFAELGEVVTYRAAGYADNSSYDLQLGGAFVNRRDAGVARQPLDV